MMLSVSEPLMHHKMLDDVVHLPTWPGRACRVQAQVRYGMVWYGNIWYGAGSGHTMEEEARVKAQFSSGTGRNPAIQHPQSHSCSRSSAALGLLSSKETGLN
ncbi:hypothetical protein TWF569_007590 [Orbilia oligospora]|nr:hypothetical protein TWF103_004780 [Orbilia oligospora]KAF3142278.1 hypothetical protein TWF569_007590 [Orbilia oligospora]